MEAVSLNRLLAAPAIMTESALSIRGLHKTYKNGLIALRGIDLEIERGDFFGLLGPNGAGKSTIIGIICSLVIKTAGSVRIMGIDLSEDPARAKRHLGIVPQEFNFNQFEPVAEIVVNQAGYYGLNRKIAWERAEYYLGELGLWSRRRDMARTLSGGMKRRLMIARALVHQPNILMLDEPTAGVDIEMRRSMWEYLTRINEQGTTIILTTHYLEEAESLCRNIGILDDGVLIENTNTRELLSRLHSEVLVLDLDQPLEQLPDLPGHRLLLVDAQTIEAEVSRDKNISSLFEALNRHGITVISMRNKVNRLEELFIQLVGNGAKEGVS